MPDAAHLRRTGTVAQCCAACDQGRKACQTPDACHMPQHEQQRHDDGAGAWIVPVIWCTAVLCAWAVFGDTIKAWWAQ